MKKITLNEFPKYSLWVGRLLNYVPWEKPSRNTEKVELEYNQDKYKKCLDYFYSQVNDVTMESIKRFEFELDPNEEICISLKDELYKIPLQEGRNRYYQLLVKYIENNFGNCASIVELGCGYGYNLTLLQEHLSQSCQFWGGEYSENAVKLGNLLNKDESIGLTKFDFYDENTYGFLEQVKAPILLFTSHAIEQLPSCEKFIKNLYPYKHKIQGVMHFEPTFERYDTATLMGLLRYCYIEANDYNKDLISQLSGRPEIQMLMIEENILGLNPLNPTSVIHWQFIGS